MTVFYLDYEGGSDAAAGTSFATRWKTITSGATAARIAPGDVIRIMGSPDPTSMGQSAQWTDGPLVATLGISSSTNATPIVMTLQVTHGYATGDTVIISGHTANTNAIGVWKVGTTTSNTIQLLNADGSNSVANGLGTNGNCRKFTNAVVTLATPVTQNIALCGNRDTKTNWTAANVNTTCSIITTDFKEGGECLRVSNSGSFITGLMAYYPTGTLDLSGYQQLSFWVKQVSGNVSNFPEIILCTGSNGTGVVHTFSIPRTNVINQWACVVVDLGTNMNSAIASIGITQPTNTAPQAFLLDNIIACKASSAADSLNLTSLISKNTGDEAWFGIQSINGTRIVLDGIVNSIPAASPQRGYAGVTESITLYKRETIKTLMAAAVGTAVQAAQEAGTALALTSYSGGWNRTDMSTQTGETWFDGQNGFGFGLNMQFTFNSVDKVNTTRYFTGLNMGSDVTIGSHYSASCSSTPISGGSRITATTLSAVCCGGPITPGAGAVVQTIARADSSTSGNGVTLGAGSWTGVIKQANNCTSFSVQSGIAGYVGIISAAHGSSNGGYASAANSVAGSVTANNSTGYGIANSSNMGAVVLGGSTAGNSSGGIGGTTGRLTLHNFTVSEASEAQGPTTYNDGRFYSENHDNTQGYSKIFCDGGLIQTQTAIVHGAAARAWKFSPTSTTRSQYYPLNLPIAKVACGANALVTIKGWFQRDNTGLTAQLICKGGQLAGIATDVPAQMSAAANTWQELTITFAPSEVGVVEIEAQFWGGSTYNGYVSDLTISQA